tara:strand:+ start:3792 stop:4544 length:753 start_codon:yes stop_codon:yes gene_type:complete
MTNNNKYFIANLKMYGNKNYLKSIKKVINFSSKKKYKKCRIIYCPPYTILANFVKVTKNTRIKIGAQNCHQNEFSGSFTGSISPNMIKSIGAKYIIIGHSENRFNGDTNTIINKKIISTLNQKLNVIFCIGETLKEKRKKKTNMVLNNQIVQGLKNIKKINNIILAYEPVWCIGTGRIPKESEIKKQLIFIKKILFNNFKVNNPIILYGGSVDPKNIESLNQIDEIKGFLIGGASRNPNKFIDIIKKSIN